MKKTSISIICLFIAFRCLAQIENINYSPAFFGPNANPVPEFTNATIPGKTSIQLSYDYYFGFGDKTRNLTVTVEIPLLKERVSLKVWSVFLENYRVTEAIYNERGMSGKLSGTENGDFYVQTRISILKEKRYTPALILNSTLKTASAASVKQRRYFDTPGYYFDVEIGKSHHLKNKILSEIRAVADLGFFCWETSGSKQNDAFMYGGKIILSNRLFDFENSLAGYIGWIKNGDSPLVYSSLLRLKQARINIFAQYQYGIRDFPYHHIQAGVSLPLEKLAY